MVSGMEPFGPVSRGRVLSQGLVKLPPWCKQISAQKLCENPVPKAIPVVNHGRISLPFQQRLLLP